MLVERVHADFVASQQKAGQKKRRRLFGSTMSPTRGRYRDAKGCLRPFQVRPSVET